MAGQRGGGAVGTRSKCSLLNEGIGKVAERDFAGVCCEANEPGVASQPPVHLSEE